jgi:hypothetical protein
MAVDKFTKWIEVMLAAPITIAKVVEFIKEIMYKFGVPNNIITDNGIVYCEGVQGLLCELGN